jgi:serine/threonine protein kinase
MVEAQRCPTCGEEVGAESPNGFCAKCASQVSGPAIAATADTGPQGGFRAGLWTAPPAADLGAHFPQLEVIELIGQGGMGAVYKAKQPKLDRLVALKILPPEAGSDPAFAERFSREARALARLNHANIITVYDFGRSGPLYHFIMEYVDGANLRQMLRAQTIQPIDALKYLPPVCDALQFAHDEGIIHRDIKPENILIDRRGRVKIADFGVAKILGGHTNQYTLTGPWQVMGTLHYMAPEQMDDPLAVDHRVDVYALGVLIYEILTGQLPLGRFSLPSDKAGVDPRWDSIVLRALDSDPTRRFQQASELKSALESIVSARVASGGAQSAGSAPRKVSQVGDSVAVPFEISKIFWIFGRAHGLVRVDGDRLVIEYQPTLMGAFRLGPREVRVPLDSIQSFTLNKGWLSTTLMIRSYRLPTFAGVPKSQQGQIALEIARKDRKLAERLVAAANHLLTLGSSAATEAPGPARPPFALRRRFKSLVQEMRSLVFKSRVSNDPPSEARTIGSPLQASPPPIKTQE